MGALKGAHGVRGEVKVKSFTDDPASMFKHGPLTDADGVQLFVPKSVRRAKDHFIVKAEPHREKEAWDALKGTKLYLPRASFPPPDTDEFYIEDLIGLTALSDPDTPVGTVRAIQNFGAGDLIEITPIAAGPTVLVPFSLHDVPQIDMANRTVFVEDFAMWADPSPGEEKAPKS